MTLGNTAPLVPTTLVDAIITSVVLVVVGGFLGMIMMGITAAVVPGLVDRMTPRIDEEKEIARGNRAVAEYFGRVVQAVIIGTAIVIGAAVFAGLR